MTMYNDSAPIYDQVYAARVDYAAGARRLRELIAMNKRSLGSTLLDVACGTGTYLTFLRGDFELEGLDLNPHMVRIAQSKLPDVLIHEADMVDFDLDKRFDVILCLGSSIGYVRSSERLAQTLRTFS